MGIRLKIEDVTNLLNRSASGLAPDTVDKLHAARRAALQHQRMSRPAPVYTWLEQHGILGHRASHHKSLNWGLTALLVIVLFGGTGYWHSISERDHSAVDIAILTDELPVHMYVD